MISLIITSYNYGHFLERSIRSAIEQSIEKDAYEIIVIDDASTDHTALILENFQENIRAVRFEKNMGLAAARNEGVRKARGQFVIFLDADDYIHRDLLRVQKLFLEENNSIDAVSTDYYVVDERGNHLKHVNAEQNPIACGIMFRKDFLINIGLYDESFRAREEEDLRIRWTRTYGIYNLIIPLYRYRMHDNNLTKNAEMMDEHLKLLTQKHS
jgi:glycosyltransferase involved in cell wall biosynthesis